MATVDKVLQVGDRSPRVAEVRVILTRLGLLDSAPHVTSHTQTEQWVAEDEVFDTSVEDALRAFQQSKGVLADGLIRESTLRLLRESTYELGKRVLAYDAVSPLQGVDVEQLQIHLQELGFYTDHIDGHFGPETYSAVSCYQRDCGLKVDGVCGPATLQNLSYLGRRIRGGSPVKIREREEVRRAGPQLTGKRIVIDPGPGGSTPPFQVSGPFGVISDDDILWDIASRLSGRMSALGVEVITSRPRMDLPLAEERAEIANAFAADLVISLRCDTYPNEKAHGCATFYFGSTHGHSSLTGELLSGYIQREIAARTQLQNCFNHGRTWDMLRLTKAPAVEVVFGYLTNPEDVAILADPRQRDTLAEAILVAIKRLYLLDSDDQPTGTFTFRALAALEGTTGRHGG